MIALTPISRFGQLISARPLALFSCLSSICLLLAHESFVSISPQTSYIPTLILVCLPLWALSVGVLSNATKVWIWISIIVGGFALISAGEYAFLQKRAHAPLADPGNYVTLLSLVWVPWLLFTAQASVRFRSFYLVALSFVFCFALLATHSRFAWLVIAVSLTLVLISKFRMGFSWPVVSQVGLGIFVAIACYVGFDHGGLNSSFLESTREISQVSPRRMLWASTVQAWHDYGGLNGTGVFTFSLLYPSVRSPLEYGTTGLLVHNDLLQLMLEGGLWLMLPFVFMTSFVVWIFSKQLFGLKCDRMLFVAASALLVAIGHSMVNFVFYVLPLIVLIGLLLGYLLFKNEIVYARQSVFSFSAQVQIRIGRLTKWGVVLLVSLNVGFLGLDIFTNGVFSGHATVPGVKLVQASTENMLSYARFAQSANPNRSTPIFAQAKILEALYAEKPTPLLLSQANATYEKAVETDAWNPHVYLSYLNFLAVNNERLGVKPEVQLRLLERAMFVNPYEVETNLTALMWFNAYGKSREIEALLRQSIEWCETMRPGQTATKLFLNLGLWAQAAETDRYNQRLDHCRNFLDQKQERMQSHSKTRFYQWLESN